ncbi:hypothetical protein LUZ60_004186 [Juncus effusus]|nr:hypothetical protein LUZ60_004186 [Juncus effusus]
MERSNSEREEEIFFDASESSQRSSIDSPIYEELIDVINPKPKSADFINEFSTMDLTTSIHERRNKFFKGVGLDEFVQSELQKDEILDFGGISETRDTVSNSPSCFNNKNNGEINLENKGVFSVIKDSINEIGSEKLKSLQDFEALLGLSGLVKRFLRKDLFVKRKNNKGPVRKFRNLWRVLTKRKLRTIELPEYNNHPKITKPTGVEVSKNNKKSTEFSSIYMDQEIQAHKGSIRVMKFSPDGNYLATGGEDSVLRVWKIRETESGICNYGKSRGVLGIIEVENLNGSGLAVVPNKVFNVLESPVHEFEGHESDILDLTWSKSHYLLTSSMDKTVRLWKVGSEKCLAVFQHSTYVTSVQFDPINEGIFMSGSIDGKVRFWRISENRVFDWVDSRHIITSISFRPDSKGFAVGCFNGTCRFYELQDENIVFSHDLKFPSTKKSSAKKITSVQYIQHGSGNLLMTTAGSKIHITDGTNTIQKYKGIRRSKSLSTPTLTSDGRHIISISDQSCVHIFNSADFTNAPSKKNKPSNKSCETFFSPNASIAVPFPGFDFDRVKVNPGRVNEIRNPLRQISDPVRECLPFGSCFFPVGSPAVTWPEEKLSLKNMKDLFLSENLGAWNTVVLTAGADGVIRSFHNYGFPVRL